MGNVIFDDLGLDYSKIMTEPEAFKKAVEESAHALREALKANNSVEVYMKKLPESKLDRKVLRDPFNAIYEAAEELPIEQLAQLADELRKLAKQVEAVAYTRVVQELTATNGVVDKAILSDQYKRLRDSYNKIVDGWKALDIYRDATSGNAWKLWQHCRSYPLRFLFRGRRRTLSQLPFGLPAYRNRTIPQSHGYGGIYQGSSRTQGRSEKVHTLMTVNFDFCSRRAKELIRDGEKELAKELIEKSIEYLNNLERHDNDSSQ
jgi:hypothetical protein